MHFQISWHVFLKVKNEFKAMRLLKQLEDNIEQKLINIKIEPSWKDKSLIDARFVTQYDKEMDIESAVFDVLLRTNEVSCNWLISKPRNNSTEEIVWSFEGISNGSRITGIEWIMFILETNTIKEYGWEH